MITSPVGLTDHSTHVVTLTPITRSNRPRPSNHDAATPNRGLEREHRASTSSLVSYPSPVYETQGWDEQITDGFPLQQVGHAGQNPSLFNVELPQCPNPKGKQVIDYLTGEIHYVPYTWHQNGKRRVYRCEKNSCQVCVVLNGRRIAGAIMLAQPPWWFCLTQVGESPSVINRRVGVFTHYLRQELPSLRVCWAAEENPDQKGCHVHGYFHAADHERRVRSEVFDHAVRQAGVGQHWEIGPVHYPAAVDYFGYLMKSLVGGDYMAQRFLGLNGSPERRRLIHSSPGFWREGVGGRTVTRSRAEVIAAKQSRIRCRDEPRHHQSAHDYV